MIGVVVVVVVVVVMVVLTECVCEVEDVVKVVSETCDDVVEVEVVGSVLRTLIVN